MRSEMFKLGAAQAVKMVAKKTKAKKPSRQLGLGEQTMPMSDVRMNTEPLAQPQKPKRY